MGRGRTKGEARAPRPSKKRTAERDSADPDARGRAHRASAAAKRAGANAARRGASNVADDDARGRPSSRTRPRGRGAPRQTNAPRGLAAAALRRGELQRAYREKSRRINGSESADDDDPEAAASSGGARERAEPTGVAARNVAHLLLLPDRAAANDAPPSDAASLAASDDATCTFPLSSPSSSSSSSSSTRGGRVRYLGSGFRLVRCMPHLKRREADAAVSAGRVLVNGALVRPSRRVLDGDVVTLDGRVMRWEARANAVEAGLGDPIGDGSGDSGRHAFVYLKYHKPRGVVCTMEPSRADSLLFALNDELTALGRAKRADDAASADHAGAGATRGAKARARRVKPVRVFPVGRLDKESSGLVLLTDDGRVSEALLDPRRKAPKTYDVDVHPPASLADAETLARGVVIETTQQRTGIATVAPTLPCAVEPVEATRSIHAAAKEQDREEEGPGGAAGSDASRNKERTATEKSRRFATLRFVLREGRNRQIRKMCEAVGLEVTRLHRTEVGGVRLGDLEVGGVRRIEGGELDALRRAVDDARGGGGGGGGGGYSGGAATRRAAEASEGWGARIARGEGGGGE